MKKTVLAMAAAAALAAGALAQAPEAAAQTPNVLTLIGPGSSIGVTVRDVAQADADAARLDGLAGVVVEAVADNTPASSAGLRTGDIVVTFDGEPVRSVRQFTRLVQETPPGRRVEAAIVRGQARQVVTVVPESRSLVSGVRTPRARGLNQLRTMPQLELDRNAVTLLRGFARPQLGASLLPLGDQLASYFGVARGALVESVAADSPAARAGLRAGDVITAIGGRAVTSPDDAVSALWGADTGATVEVVITRDRQSQTLTVELPERPAPVARRGAQI